MATQMRTYSMKEGQLENWNRMFESKIRDLRSRQGFALEGAWSVPDRGQFVWILSYPGGREDFERADQAYYELPEHGPLHIEALEYLEGGDSVFVDPVSL
ncbi:MAG TPA: NIPSNAP family containing protein [Acidimicrobiia bacterium]|nr:NIPSNAP family containing protein [Acidimicrobiia bacterium]